MWGTVSPKETRLLIGHKGASLEHKRVFYSGLTYRYPYDNSPDLATVDGMPNFFFVTNLEGYPRPSLMKGISQIAASKSRQGLNPFDFPAIIISSSPHNRGSESNPWHDVFEPDLGYVRYFGDAKKPGNPSESPGNRILLNELAKHTSGDRATRALATPLVFFERVKSQGRAHGNLKFHGFGVIERAELVTQYNPQIGYFTNYLFSFAVLGLADEGEQLNWQWINDRRNPNLEGDATLEHAPASWRKWVRVGNTKIESVRRRASLGKLEPVENQRPSQGTREAAILDQIHAFYSQAGRHRFELLASRVVMAYINGNGANYSEGWVTQGSGDGGVDFVGKVRLGSGFASVDIVVLGQAKCEAPDKPTNGNALARTVARLKRGWIGAYVTTSYFSKAAQQEVIEDAYPLLKINGKILAEVTLKLVEAGGFHDVLDFMTALENEYPTMIQNRRAEEILDF